MRNKLFTRVSKKAFAVLLSAAMMVPGVMAYAAEAEESVTLYYGDVDQNGEVTAEDALSILKHVVKLQVIGDEVSAILADANQNDEITAEDALLALQVVVKLVDAVPYEPATPEPTETPVPTATPVPTETPVPTPTPVRTPTPQPTVNPAWYPCDIPDVEPGEAVEGTTVAVVETNGATVDENGVITFTDENKANKKGVQLENPFAGRTDLRMTVAEALEGQATIAPEDDKAKIYDPTFAYPRPVWTNGVSVSFWAKADWKNPVRTDNAPILVFHNSEDIYFETGGLNIRDQRLFALSISLNGSAHFESGDTPKNSLRNTSILAGENNVWNYYTVTIANDWVTVYVNGQENVYKSVVLLSDSGTEFFNDGFMTRYNTVGTPTQEDIDNDIRGYIKSAGGWYKDGDEMVGHNEIGIMGNSRYANPGSVSGASPLLMDYITGENTQLWIGGTPTKKLDTTSFGLFAADYRVNSGTQVADVQTYEKELTAAEVAANYAAAVRPDGTPVSAPEEIEPEVPAVPVG